MGAEGRRDQLTEVFISHAKEYGFLFNATGLVILSCALVRPVHTFITALITPFLAFASMSPLLTLVENKNCLLVPYLHLSSQVQDLARCRAELNMNECMNELWNEFVNL